MILVFLPSLRSTLVTAVSIPLSVVLALIVLWTRDLSLNMLTLGALTIAIGRVVDDSIVVLENIKRHLGYGEERQRRPSSPPSRRSPARSPPPRSPRSRCSCRSALVGGMVGELFGSFSLTVTVALLASLLVSLTVVPVLSYWFLRAPKVARGHRPGGGRAARPRRRRRAARSSGSTSRSCASRPAAGSPAWCIAVVVLVGTFGMAPAAEDQLLRPGRARTVLTVKQELKPGTSLAATDEQAKKVEKLLAAIDGVEDYQVTVGSSGFMAAFGGGTGANQASYQLKLKDAARRPTRSPTTHAGRARQARPVHRRRPPSPRATASAART